MPVTPLLSKAFYDRLGEEVANELVGWFNSVDATYRSDLRELNDRNFMRFESAIDQRFAKLEARFAQIDIQFGKVDTRFAAVESLLREHIAAIDVRMAQFEARMMRWMLTFWIGTMGGLAALVWAIAGTR